MKLWIKNRAVEIMLITIFGAFLLSALSVDDGAKSSGDRHEVSAKDYYIENTYEETGGRNIVAGIYLDYRLFDSILEAGILLASASGIIFISKKDDEV